MRQERLIIEELRKEIESRKELNSQIEEINDSLKNDNIEEEVKL
jgi:hypothetical protein